MKKSTIFMLIIIYLAAFFVVGLMGIKLQSFYKVDYLNEILVEQFDEHQGLARIEDQCSSTVINEGQEVSEDKVRKQNVITFKTTTPYTVDMVIKLKVNLVPSNTSYDDFKLHPVTSNRYKVTKDESDKTIYVTDIKKYTTYTKVSFTLEDLQNHKIKTDVVIYVY